MRYFFCLFVLALCLPSYAASIFSCDIGKNGKRLSLTDDGGFIDYAYGPRNAEPEIRLRQSAKEIEYFAWSGVGRDHTYSLTFANEPYRYTVFTSVDSIKQRRDSGVYVEKGNKLLTTLGCRERSVQGDLEEYVSNLSDSRRQ